MNQIDNDFFEAYKHLDKLCGEIFDCNNGVNQYITQMENTPRGSRLVPMWDHFYKDLKHIRWIRNRIAHDTGDSCISSNEDLAFVNSFYSMIMNQSDPLSRLRIIECDQAAKKAQKRAEVQILSYEPQVNKNLTGEQNGQDQNEKGPSVGCLCWLGIFLILFLLCMYMLKYLFV